MADNLLMPEGSDPYYGQKYMPSGQELRAYQPTWRDRIGAWFMGDEKSSPERNRLMEGLIGSRGLGETGPSAIDFTPAGIPLGINDAWHKGDDRGMAMAIFGGPMAKTADRVALKTAEEMAAKGLTREQIFKDTGWFKGVDGKWRFEIDDSGSKLTPALEQNITGEKRGMFRGDASEGFDHPGLYAAYPDAASERMVANREPNPGGAYWRNEEGGPGGGFSATGPNPESVRSTIMHELGGHGVQAREGFARGGASGEFSRSEIAAERNRLMSGMEPSDWTAVSNVSGDMTDKDVARSLYNRLAGEVEARTVQKRLNLTPDQRRARPPWLDYDVPEQDQIVRFGGSGPRFGGSGPRFGGSGPQMSIKPPPGIRAYHGSPHDFDKFDISKIGTGEGAQAYGHGLYFAENEGVAKQYRKKLSPSTTSEAAAQDLAEANGRSWGDMGAYERQSYIDEAQRQNIQPSRPVNGKTYEVSINAHPDDFLDWDKPLSQQIEKVRGALDSAGYTPYTVVDANGKRIDMSRGQSKADAERFAAFYNGRAIPKEDADFDAVLKAYGLSDNGAKKISSVLRDAGIPGIKYLDQGSRTAGEGSRNYVVFDDKIIDIVKKYGIAAAASMYGLDAVNQAMGAAQDQPQNLLMQGYDQAGY